MMFYIATAYLWCLPSLSFRLVLSFIVSDFSFCQPLVEWRSSSFVMVSNLHNNTITCLWLRHRWGDHFELMILSTTICFGLRILLRTQRQHYFGSIGLFLIDFRNNIWHLLYLYYLWILIIIGYSRGAIIAY